MTGGVRTTRDILDTLTTPTGRRNHAIPLPAALDLPHADLPHVGAIADAEQLPLAKVLEGGTWAAGRRIARERREGGGPPLTIVSDGTVF